MFNHSIDISFLFNINSILSPNVNVETRSSWLPVNNQRNGCHGDWLLPGKSDKINSRLFGENDKFFKGHIKRFKTGGSSKVSPSKIKVHLQSKRLNYTCERAHF